MSSDNRLPCGKCGQPLRVSWEESLKLDCDGIHFLEKHDGEEDLIPIRRKGLRIGYYSMVEEVDFGEAVVVGAYCLLVGGQIGDRTIIKDYTSIKNSIIGCAVVIESYVEIREGARIGDGAYIGSHALIGRDVIVGRGAFVGSGSVVLNDVRDMEVISLRSVK